MNKDMEKFLPPEEKNVDNDYKYSRDTYYELVEKGKESLELMIEVARESEHPRAFEVLSGMIKNISDVNDRLMDLNKNCLLYTSPSPRDTIRSRMPSSA